MYAAKRRGRNRAEYFSDDLGLMARERLTLENQLRGAIGRGEIHVHYQPEVDLASKAVVRFEALARWSHPQLGEITPNRFIPVAEESGLIHALGSHVMEQACREAVKWQEFSAAPIEVAVNVSPIQFNSETIIQDIGRILERTGLRPQLLQVELTESVMMGSLQRSLEKMQGLRALGVTLALDDFGTGYSTLVHLQALRADILKIDRSFVAQLGRGERDREIIVAVTAMAHALGMTVVGEGIETDKQLDSLVAMECDVGQGYVFAPPVTPAEIADLHRAARVGSTQSAR